MIINQVTGEDYKSCSYGQLLPLGQHSFRVTSPQSVSHCKFTAAKLKVQFSLVIGTEEKREGNRRYRQHVNDKL